MNLQEFIKQKVQPLVDAHPLITTNPYTQWFSKGSISEAQMIDFITQYTVISSNFVAIQALRVANAETPASEKAARWILMTELGVWMDLKTGSPEGRTFKTEDAHINWIRKAGATLGLDSMKLGRWNSAAECTQVLLTKLKDAYARPDSFGSGASFGLEVWAGYGIGTELDHLNFWNHIVSGIQKFNEKNLKSIDYSFFKFHHDIEIGHTNNVYGELEELSKLSEFDSEKWLSGVLFVLDTWLEFWEAMHERK